MRCGTAKALAALAIARPWCSSRRAAAAAAAALLSAFYTKTHTYTCSMSLPASHPPHCLRVLAALLTRRCCPHVAGGVQASSRAGASSRLAPAAASRGSHAALGLWGSLGCHLRQSGRSLSAHAACAWVRTRHLQLLLLLLWLRLRLLQAWRQLQHQHRHQRLLVGQQSWLVWTQKLEPCQQHPPT